MSIPSNFTLLNPSALQETLQNTALPEAAKAKLCAQQFDSLIFSQVLEKALDSPFREDKDKAMAGKSIYSTLTAQVLAQTLTQEGGLKLAVPTYFSSLSALSPHESSFIP